jgi:hypothetical protein
MVNDGEWKRKADENAAIDQLLADKTDHRLNQLQKTATNKITMLPTVLW